MTAVVQMKSIPAYLFWVNEPGQLGTIKEVIRCVMLCFFYSWDSLFHLDTDKSDVNKKGEKSNQGVI